MQTSKITFTVTLYVECWICHLKGLSLNVSWVCVLYIYIYMFYLFVINASQ